jgi:hypothetical protein
MVKLESLSKAEREGKGCRVEELVPRKNKSIKLNHFFPSHRLLKPLQPPFFREIRR